MAKTTKDEVLKVSECCHGGFTEIEKKGEYDEGFVKTGEYLCAVCKQPCNILELLVEEK